MNLAIFDIDGTLTDTNPVDELCFKKTFLELHQIADVSSDWASYAHSTDSGIVDEVFRTRLGRRPTSQDLQVFIDHFVKNLEHCAKSNPGFFKEIPGAKSILRELKLAGWAVAISTGAWRRSAEFKLSQAGILFESIPLAVAEDAFQRTKIIQTAIERAAENHRLEKFERSVYFGDGSWDLQAARDLQIPFLRITHNPTSDRELSAYCPPATILRALDLARIP